jgi:hypothetical protein
VDALDHKTSYTQQFLLNIQQQVGQQWAFEIGYLGALSGNLYGFMNANTVTPYGYIGSGTSSSVASRTPYPNFGFIQLVHDFGTATYNALSVKATRRFNNGLNVVSSYTYAKSLDDTSGIRPQGNDLLFPQNSACIPCEKGLSAFDVRNRIVASVIYDLPIGTGKLLPAKGILDQIVGGWEVGTIFTHQSGAPVTPQTGANNSSVNTAGGTFDRPNGTGISPYLHGSARSLSDWVNIKAYTPNTPGTYGNVSRGSFIGPGITNFDANIHKQFKMPYNESHQMSIRFEAFNALNHPNWGAPAINLGLPSFLFGRIGGTGSMRQLQLAAKYTF